MWADAWYWVFVILVALAALAMLTSGRFRGLFYEFWNHVAPLFLKWGWVYLLIGGMFVLMSDGTIERIIHAARGG